MRRFSLRTLMAFIVVSAVGLAALRNANEFWAGIMLLALLAASGMPYSGQSSREVVTRHGGRASPSSARAISPWPWGLVRQYNSTHPLHDVCSQSGPSAHDAGNIRKCIGFTPMAGPARSVRIAITRSGVTGTQWKRSRSDRCEKGRCPSLPAGRSDPGRGERRTIPANRPFPLRCRCWLGGRNDCRVVLHTAETCGRHRGVCAGTVLAWSRGLASRRPGASPDVGYRSPVITRFGIAARSLCASTAEMLVPGSHNA